MIAAGLRSNTLYFFKCFHNLFYLFFYFFRKSRIYYAIVYIFYDNITGKNLARMAFYVIGNFNEFSYCIKKARNTLSLTFLLNIIFHPVCVLH